MAPRLRAPSRGVEFRRFAGATLLIVEVSSNPVRFRRNETQEEPSGSLSHGGANYLCVENDTFLIRSGKRIVA